MEKIVDVIAGTKFEADLGEMFKFNDGQMSRGVYNLIVSIRDMKLFCKIGMKPNRHWRMKDVKWYFGVKGDKHKILAQLEAFLEALKMPEKES